MQAVGHILQGRAGERRKAYWQGVGSGKALKLVQKHGYTHNVNHPRHELVRTKNRPEMSSVIAKVDEPKSAGSL